MSTLYPAVIQDSQTKEWLYFQKPVAVFETHKHEEIQAHLDQIEKQVEEQGLYAVGFLSYEASSAFDEALTAQTASHFPLLWFGLYQKPIACVSPLDLSSEKPPWASNSSKLSTSETSSLPPLTWTPSVSQEEYERALKRVKMHIARGDTYQVNYTFRLRTPFSGAGWVLFLQMLRGQTTPYASYIGSDKWELCSASPELFFQLDGDELRAKPMKGTAPRGETKEKDEVFADWLYHSEKNRAENVMIVDMLRNDMSRIALSGSVHTPSLFQIEEYPTVWQMVSHVRAKTQATLCEIMTALFPCASITGAPKASTMQIIAQLENAPRNIYTGCIGTVFPNRKMQFNVAIRTVLIDQIRKEAELGIGGGIVWDSNLQDEYQECLLKARFLVQNNQTFQS